MTIRDIIEQIDETKENGYSNQQKTRWIASLDGTIARDLMLQSPLEIEAKYAYRWPEDAERVPLVRFPDDEIYALWLAAKISEANREYDDYRAEMRAYNARYHEFATWWLNRYDPAQG